MIVGGGIIGKIMNKNGNANIEIRDKIISYYNILNQWLELKQDGISLVQYFEENNYRTVAIYGMKELGERLYEELRLSQIEVKYAIDRNADNIHAELEVIHPDEELPDVDVIVVTASFYYDDIEDALQKKTNCKIVSLEDIVYEI